MNGKYCYWYYYINNGKSDSISQTEKKHNKVTGCPFPLHSFSNGPALVIYHSQHNST